MPDFDFVIIGSGPGGYVAAARAGQLGAKAAVIEKDLLGGTCLNWGCIPTKTLISSGRMAAMARSMKDFGVEVGEVKIDYAAMAARKDKVVKILRDGVEHLLTRRNVEIIRGHGRLVGKGKVEVAIDDGGSRTLEAANVIIATGSAPVRPAIFNIDGERILTSRDAVAKTSLGKSVIVVGGGYIGCEYAALYANLGLEVTVLELLDTILAGQDSDVIKHVGRGLKRRKVKLRTGVRVESLAALGDGVKAVLENGDEISADFALVAVGRRPVTGDIGLETVGIETDNGCIPVDEHCMSAAESVYAIGDITGRVQLAHVASAQGVVAVEHALGNDSKMEYDVIPSCIFTDPESASVGLTEEQAAEKGLDYKVGRFQFRALGKAQAEGRLEGLVKVIGQPEGGRIIGAHVVGSAASELIAELALAMKTGATAEEITQTIHAHPTLPEALKEAVEDLEGRAIHVV